MKKEHFKIPNGTTHIHKFLYDCYKRDGYIDPSMFEKWVKIPHKITSHMVYHWSGSKWILYDTFQKRDTGLRGNRSLLKDLFKK